METVYFNPGSEPLKSLAKMVSDDLRDNRLVMLLGAGISHSEPSNLSLAGPLQAELQETIWRAADLVIPQIRPTKSEIEAAEQVVGDARLERLLDALYQTHGRKAIDYVSVLNGEVWNENHAAIAALAETALLPECITLNFDLLIEEAVKDRKCSCTTICPLIKEEFPYGGGPRKLRLLKPHGSFTPKTVSSDPYRHLSATLSQVGSEPVSANLNEFREILSRRPVLLVAGYSDNDWDIYPILLRYDKLIQRVVWVEYATGEDLNDPEFRVEKKVDPRVLRWLRDSRDNTVLAAGNIKDLLRAVMPLTNCLEPLNPSKQIVQKPTDPSQFAVHGGIKDKKAMRTVVALAIIISETGAFSTSLLKWLLRDPIIRADIKLVCLIEDLLGHARHTQGYLLEAIKHSKNVIQAKQTVFGDAEAAPNVVWLGYEYLCLAKRPSLRPWKLILLPYWLFRGYKSLKAGPRMAAAKERAVLQAMSSYYLADLFHSWGNLLMFGGPKLTNRFRWLFRRISHAYEKIAELDDFMSTGYYWLRSLEAKLLAGSAVDRNQVVDRLEELFSSYRLTQNHVQMGNVAAYKALLVFLLDGDVRLSEAFLIDAEKLWCETKEQMASGMRRVALFRRFVGIYGFWSSLQRFLVSA